MVGVAFAASLVPLASPTEPQAVADRFCESLKSWAGKEISQLPSGERSKFADYVAAKLLSADERDDPFASPSVLFANHGDAYVWRFNEGNTKFLILVSRHRGLSTDSDEDLLFLTDREGSVIHRFSFYTHAWIDPESVKYQKFPWLKGPVIIQEMQSRSRGHGLCRVYFGFDGSRPAAIRIEDRLSKPLPVDYWYPDPAVDPKYAPPAKAEMERVLIGPDDIKRLEALIWLTGRHGDVGQNTKDMWHEATADEVKYENFMHDPEICKLVTNLRSSPNPWVRDIAREAHYSRQSILWWQDPLMQIGPSCAVGLAWTAAGARRQQATVKRPTWSAPEKVRA
jgi:hypothetical protein